MQKDKPKDQYLFLTSVLNNRENSSQVEGLLTLYFAMNVFFRKSSLFLDLDKSNLILCSISLGISFGIGSLVKALGNMVDNLSGYIKVLIISVFKLSTVIWNFSDLRNQEWICKKWLADCPLYKVCCQQFFDQYI